MTESTWKILKLDWKTPGRLLEFFLWEPCKWPILCRVGCKTLAERQRWWRVPVCRPCTQGSVRAVHWDDEGSELRCRWGRRVWRPEQFIGHWRRRRRRWYFLRPGAFGRQGARLSRQLDCPLHRRDYVFGSRPSDHYFRSVCLSVCLFVCLCRVFLSRLWSDLDQTRTHVTRPGLVVSPRI